MSSNKETKQQRIAHNARLVANRLDTWKHYNDGSVTPKRLGSMRKRNPLNCGRSRCHMCCNPRRLFGQITFNEQKENVRYKDMLKDYVGFGESITDEYDGI